MNRIRRNDTVIVIAGKSKKHIGKVLKIEEDRVLVEGANMIKKHVKPNPQLDEKGGIKQIEATIHRSNVALYNPETSRADRIGFKFLEKDGKKEKVRYYKSNDQVIDVR